MLLNNKNRQARWLVLLVMVMVVMLLSACGKGKDDPAATSSPSAGAATPAHADSEIAAVYKGGQVTYGELNNFIKMTLFNNAEMEQYKDLPAFQEEELKKMITFKIVIASASEKAKTDAAAAVKQQMEAIKAATGDQKTQFETGLKNSKLSIEDVEKFSLMSATALFEMMSKVTEPQIKEFYDKVVKESPSSLVATATLNHILIATKDLADTTGTKQLRTQDEALKIAKDVQEQLKKSGDFVALAKKYSDDTGTKETGGKYDNADISQFVTEFKEAAATLPLNTISDPILTEFGYHVMKVESRVTRTLPEVTEAIKQNLAQEGLQKYMVDELPKNDYKSNLPTPEPEPSATPAASPTAAPAK